MPSKLEKKRRRQIQIDLREKEYREFIESLPIEKELIIELFDYLDNELEKQNCNDDYKIAKSFFQIKGMNNEKIYEWFKKNGGYCDCEILYNIEEKFE